jgi:hypothetical protein
MDIHPPKPTLALAIGVIGHRPDRLPQTAISKIEADVSDVFKAVSTQVESARIDNEEFFSASPSLLSCVSALAEGADRIAAEVGLRLGWILDVVLPFSIMTYEVDFKTDESRFTFDALRSRARSVLVLPGERQSAQYAYKSAGLTVLDQSDLVLAIWDHGPSAGQGGTADLLRAATQLDIPIIHVDANGLQAPCVRWSQLDEVPIRGESFEELPANEISHGLKIIIEKLVQPPKDGTERSSLKRYFDEFFISWNLRLEFPLLMRVFGARKLQNDDLRPTSPESHAGRLLALEARGSQLGPMRIATAYGWADFLATRFAQIFRSAFVINFLFASAAVVLAVASLLFGHDKKYVFVSGELILIALVLANTLIGQWKAWHHRWFESREIAERLRIAFAFWLLGARPTSFPGQEPAWTGWYTRAICRDQGIRSGSIDEETLRGAQDALLALLNLQCGYHDDSTSSMGKLERGLDRFGLSLFFITGLSALLFLISIPFVAVTDMEAIWMTVLASSLPALATATYGIRVIGDFEGTARRSGRTKEILKRLAEAIGQDRVVTLARLRSRTRSAAETMLGDVSSWRIAAEGRSLSIPG